MGISTFSPVASGIIIIRACGRDLPVANNNSKVLSKEAVSLAPGVIMGNNLFISSPKNSDENIDSLAVIQFIFPLIVFISPL